MVSPIEGRRAPSEARILEVGEHCLIGRALPDVTDYACTSLSSLPPALPSTLRRLDPMATIRSLRTNGYGLVIAHAPAYAPWQSEVLRYAARRPIARGGSLLLRALLLRWLPPRTPLIILDLEDAPIIHAHNIPLLDRALLCFKRELPADRARVFMDTKAPALPGAAARRSEPLAARLAKFRPISSGLSAEVLASAPLRQATKTSDIFFAGEVAGSSTLRQSGFAELCSLAKRGLRIDLPEERLDLPRFLERASAAQMVWSPEGYAHECFRHYETAACWSVPVINTPGIERYRPLRQGLHAIYYPMERGGLTAAVVRALREPDRLLKMGKAARRHAMRHHSHVALAHYVLAETAAALARRGEGSLLVPGLVSTAGAGA